jgi:hypothetical protein
LDFLARAIRQEEEIKGIGIGKEEVKLSLSADDLTLHLKGPKKSTKKLIDIIKNFSKVAEYKINVQKISSLSYNSNEQTEEEYRNTIPLTWH